jgi:phosphoglycerate kinase
MRGQPELKMPAFRTLDDVNVSNKKVVIRLDLNVPIQDGVVTDTTRIDRVVPTLKELLSKGAAVIILAHFDRPKGKVVPEMSLKPVAPALEKALGSPVTFVFTDWQSAPSIAATPGTVTLMENTRYHAGEEKNDQAFAKLLGGLGDIFVNDAFSAAHRAHSSTEGIAHIIPAYAGRAMEAELKALQAALEKPTRPLVAVVGGAKVSSKLELLGNLSKVANTIVIGGGMANTFLAAQGFNVGKSLCEHDLIATAKDILATAKANNCTLLLPVDGVVAKEFKAGAASETVGIDAVPADGMMLDVGAKSIANVKACFDDAKTVVWNGPMGAFEIAPFDTATNAVAQHAAALTKAGKLVTVAGGGDTVSALNHAGAANDFTYISTAGGAFLEWLEGKELPGVKALEV